MVEGGDGSVGSMGGDGEGGSEIKGESENESERSFESESAKEEGRMMTVRRMRPCCREGVTEEMVRMFAEVMVLRQFEVGVEFVHEGIEVVCGGCTVVGEVCKGLV